MQAVTRKEELISGNISVIKAVAIVALPLMLSTLFRTANDFVDTAIIGMAENASEMHAGVAYSAPLVTALEGLVIGIAVAVGIMVSRAVGEKNTQKAGAGCLAGLIFGLAVCAVTIPCVIIFASNIMSLIAYESAVETASAYLAMRVIGLAPLLLGEVYRWQRQSQGDTVAPLLVTILSVLVNVGLTYVVVIVLNCGVWGAGLATTLSYCVFLPFAIWSLFFSKKYIVVKSLATSKGVMSQIIKLAVPLMLSIVVPSVGFTVLGHLMYEYGQKVVTAYSICNRICNVLISPQFALASVMTTFISTCEGNGNKKRAHDSYVVGRNISVIYGLVICALLAVFGGLFIDSVTADSAVRLASYPYLIVLGTTLPLMSLTQAISANFNAKGKPTLTFILELVRIWALRLPLTFFCTAMFSGQLTVLNITVIMSNIITLCLALILKKVLIKKETNKKQHSHKI